MSDATFKLAQARAELLESIAKRISDTLYYANGAIHSAWTLADEKGLRHDDYDLLRAIAKDIRIEAHREELARLEEK